MATKPLTAKLCCCIAAIVKPKAGPKGKVYTEEDWNTEADENAQGADAYRYSKVTHSHTLCNSQALGCLFWCIKASLVHPQSSSDYVKFVILHQTCACTSSIVTLSVTALANTAHSNSACSGLCDQFCYFAHAHMLACCAQ